ncbi:MAG: M23 family metallopeptidase, partial [Candidatus Acidiferrales bacterium]
PFNVLAISLLSLVAATFAPAVGAQQTPQCSVKPASIPLGQTVRLHCDVEVATAVMVRDPTAKLIVRSVPMFKQADGSWEGLMPVAVEDDPETNGIIFKAADGTAVAGAEVSIRKTIFPTQNVTLAPQIEALHTTPEERQTLVTFRDAVSDVKYWDDPLVAPLPGCVISPFGVKRLHNGKPTGEIHAGIDQRGATGTPIRAVAAGVVKIVQPFNVLGGTVAIDHGQGLETMYLHMSRANGPHLHWVVYVNGVPQNPLQWVTLKSCAAPKNKSQQ